MNREVLANTRELAERVLRILTDCPGATIDTETSGLDWKRHHIIGYVITFRDENSYYVPVRHAGGGNLEGCHVPMTAEGWRGDLHWFELALAKIVNERPRHWVGHNLIFDLRFSKKHGIDFYGSKEDTMVNAPLIDENQFGYSLEACAKREEVQAKKGTDLYVYMASIFGGEPDRKQMGNYWRTDASVDIVWEYAAGDGVTTEELLDKQTPQITEEDHMGKSLKLVHSVECRLINTLTRMTYGGVRIDEERLHRADKLFEKKAAEASKNFPKDFNSKSPKQIKSYLESQGIDLGPQSDWPRNEPTTAEMKKARAEGRDPLGALKFDADTLKLIPQGAGIIDFRQMTNARTLYTGPMIHRHLWNGGVHCDFAQMAADDYGTISGRLSCYDPNLQAVSKRNKKIGPVYRACFVADPGCTWEDNDYGQQEYVVFADYTGDPNLIAGYAANPPVDIHSTVASMLGIERDPGAKRMNLGMLYGMGIVKLAISLGVSVQQAKIWMDDYHRKFPYAKPFLEGCEKKAKARGYVFTKLGRRRHFQPSFAHKAGNGIIQGTSADITKLKMVEIDEYFASEGDYCRLMLQIHDSLSWSAPDDEKGRKQSAEARRIMTDFYSDEAVIKLKANLRIDAASGANWAEATWGQDVVEMAWAA